MHANADAGGWRELPIRVRFQETDKMQVVYHTNYANWFEWGRTEWIREAGWSYQHIEQLGLMLPVVGLRVLYEWPAYYDDELVVRTRVSSFSALRLTFDNEVWRGTERLVHGGTDHVWLNKQWKPARLDRAAPELYRLLKDITGVQRKGKKEGEDV